MGDSPDDRVHPGLATRDSPAAATAASAAESPSQTMNPRRRTLPQQTIRLRLPTALPAVRSRRTQRIAEWFGLRAKRAGETPPSGNPHELDRLIPRPGQILLI